jgi:hypothetical protein
VRNIAAGLLLLPFEKTLTVAYGSGSFKVESFSTPFTVVVCPLADNTITDKTAKTKNLIPFIITYFLLFLFF